MAARPARFLRCALRRCQNLPTVVAPCCKLLLGVWGARALCVLHARHVPPTCQFTLLDALAVPARWVTRLSFQPLCAHGVVTIFRLRRLPGCVGVVMVLTCSMSPLVFPDVNQHFVVIVPVRCGD